jgi:ATP-dependent DNA helicase RecQ
MYFHLKTYGGIEDELKTLLGDAELLGPTDSMKRLSLPFGSDDSGREKALHRLMLLGIVSDYLKEFGPKEFTVTLNPTTPESVVASLLGFVERSQPGRAQAVKAKIDREYRKLPDALESCGRALLEFVYDTIERSRRRSLREMWLAARESKTDEHLRTRVLEYLSEGDILPSLQELVDDEVFQYSDWQPLLEGIDNPEAAREWRASTARELASYPDHPGLLVGRAFAEAIDPDGNLREFEFNLESSLNSARRNYSTTDQELAGFLRWAKTTLRPMNLDASICAASLSSDLGVGESFNSEELIALAREGSIHAGILLMAGAMKRAHEMAVTTDELLNN